MARRKVGHTQLEAAPLAFGGNVFGWTADESSSFDLLDAFVDADCNLIDTADVYSRWAPGLKGGESETIIGKWLKQSGKRDKVIIATKVGMEMEPGKKGLSRAHIQASVEDSLRRLQTDYIDLYFSHKDDPDVPLEETLETYARLIQQGKIRAIGASNFSAERLEEALQISEREDLPAYECLEPNYNLYDRSDYEDNLEPICLKYGLGVISYFALASGFLTGKYRTEADVANSPRARMVKPYWNERGFRIVDALEQVARQYGTTPASVAIAWVVARPGITAAIASATNVKQLGELVRAIELTLDPASMDMLNKASSA
ncbi:MAG: aldo/keto reductase [Herminiimonas sp.]|nr:aldo/keto reductase [Herminiimonas sp.]